MYQEVDHLRLINMDFEVKYAGRVGVDAPVAGPSSPAFEERRMAFPKISPHHQAWLDAHPHRTATWLRSMVADGFDVHHVDGNRENNDSTNLVLIERRDHSLLHYGHRNFNTVSFLSSDGER